MNEKNIPISIEKFTNPPTRRHQTNPPLKSLLRHHYTEKYVFPELSAAFSLLISAQPRAALAANIDPVVCPREKDCAPVVTRHCTCAWCGKKCRERLHTHGLFVPAVAAAALVYPRDSALARSLFSRGSRSPRLLRAEATLGVG